MKKTLYILFTICFIFNCNTTKQPRLGEIITDQLKNGLHYGDTLSLSIKTKNINQPVFTWSATAGFFDDGNAQTPHWTAPDETGTITISVSVLGNGINSVLTKTIRLEVSGPGDAILVSALPGLRSIMLFPNCRGRLIAK